MCDSTSLETQFSVEGASQAVSRDGTLLITGGSKSEPRTARVWTIADGKQAKRLEGAHAHDILAVAFSPDGRHALTASPTEPVQVWEVSTAANLAPADLEKAFGAK